MNLSIADIDDALAEKKWPRISPWWWNIIEEVYASLIPNIVIRGGRRGGKSSTICGKIAVFELLNDHHNVPPGDTGYFAILSADKDQAQERLETCHQALKDLGIAHRKTATEITLNDRNVGIKAFAATLQAVVSFTCIGYLCDEMARWRDKDTGENPAKQILTSLRATMLTMPNARGWYVSAPWSTLDEHHRMVEAGTNESQLVYVGTSLDMNPTLTADMITRLEPDEPSRMREYYVIPMPADETKFFAAQHVDEAHATSTEIPIDGVRTLAGADVAFRKNSSALAVLTGGERGLWLRKDREWKPGLRALVPSETLTEIAQDANELDAEGLACDLHYVESMREHLDALDIPLLEFPTTNEGIAMAYVRTRVLLSQGLIDLSAASTRLLEQLKQTTVQPTVTGLTIKNKTTSDGAHGDLVSAFVAAVWCFDQDVPLRKMLGGSRRFARGAPPDENSTMRDYEDE